MCVRRLHYDKKYHGAENQNNQNREKKLCYRCLRSRNCGDLRDLRDLRRGLQRARAELIWNLSYRASTLKSKNRRNWWSYRETVEEQFVVPIFRYITCQPCLVRLYHQYLQIVSSLSLCHYYPYINLYLCKLNSVTKNLLQTICSFFLLLFDVQISSLFFLLISLERHMIFLLWNDRLFKLTFLDSLHSI